jgi:hypothetical protein
VLSCTGHGSDYLYAVDEDIAKGIEQEKTFYRGLLEQICQDARKTRARRLAESGLMFWDSMQAEKSKRANDVGKKRPTTHDIDAIIELLQIARKSLARAEECRDQGAGYWDCAKLDKCVNPQCDDCPQKMPNDPS